MTERSPVQTTVPSEEVVRRIASQEGVDPAELPPLDEVVDPSDLDALGATGDRPEAASRIEFTYCGHEVTVTSAGEIHLDDVVSPQPNDEIVFSDIEGQKGCITEELEIDYRGRWTDAVEACIRTVETKHRSGGSGSVTMDISNDLLITLGEEVPLAEIERRV